MGLPPYAVSPGWVLTRVVYKGATVLARFKLRDREKRCCRRFSAKRCSDVVVAVTGTIVWRLLRLCTRRPTQGQEGGAEDQRAGHAGSGYASDLS